MHAPEQLLDRLGAHLGLEFDAPPLPLLAVLILGEQLLFLEVRVARVDNDVGLEVENALEVTKRQVEQVPDPARQAFEEPHMAHRRGQLDVPEALATDFGLCHFDTALVADHAAVLHALVLAAQALPVGDGPEDLGAEQAVPLRLEGPVVDRLRLGNLAVRPLLDALG